MGYYDSYTAVRGSAPQQSLVNSKVPEVLAQAGSLFQKSMNSIRDRELEDAKIAQEQKRYDNQLAFQTRQEDREIAKIAEERAKTLATNNALAVMENPNVVTSLNTSASDATSQNALTMYNNANADGIITAQERALLDSTYQKDLARDVLTSGSADQKSLFDARQSVEKLKMQKEENQANADYRAKALAQQANASNLQNRMYNDQKQMLEDQNNMAAVIIGAMQSKEKNVPNNEYTNLTDQINKATGSINEFEKTNPTLANTNLSADIVNQFIKERDNIKKSSIAPEPDFLGVGDTETTPATASVNAKLLEAVGGNKDLYINLLQANTPEKVLEYMKNKNDLPTMNKNLLVTPQDIRQVVTPTKQDISNTIISNDKVKPTLKLAALNMVNSDDTTDGLGSLVNSTSKGGKSGTGLGIFGSDSDGNSLSNKKYKESKVAKQEVLNTKLQDIMDKNGGKLPDKLINDLSQISTVEGREQYIENNYTKEFTPKNSIDTKMLEFSDTLKNNIIKSEDTDSDSSKNINTFLKLNESVFNQLPQDKVKQFTNDVLLKYQEQGKSFIKNPGNNSGIGDAIQNAIDDWNELNPNNKLIKPSFGW